MTLHDLITLMILPIGTSGTNEIQYMKYTSHEYILKLQIHQHLGVVLVILSFLYRLVMIPVCMEPLLMPLVSQSCPSFYVEAMLPISLHLPYALI